MNQSGVKVYNGVLCACNGWAIGIAITITKADYFFRPYLYWQIVDEYLYLSQYFKQQRLIQRDVQAMKPNWKKLKTAVSLYLLVPSMGWFSITFL